MRRGMQLALLLSPLLLAACAKTGTPAAAAKPSAAASPWILAYGGTAAPSPTPSISVSSPGPFPTGFLPTGTVSASPTPSGTDCAGSQFHAGMIDAAGVVAGSTSATVSWYNPGGAELVAYRVTAISQNPVAGAQRDIGWTVVQPGAGCRTISVPVTGLDRRTSYVFSVDAVFTRLGEDGTWAATVARSAPTTTS